MNKTTIFFDMDNTLIDRMEAAKLTYRHILKYSNIPDEDHDAVFNTMWSLDDNGEYPKSKIFEKIASEYHFDNQWVKNMTDLWFATLPEYTIIFEKTVSTLKQLKSRYKIGMITNGSFVMQSRKIEVANFSYLFDAIIISGEHNLAKPQKELFLLACNKIGCLPQEAYFVGDSIKNDIYGSFDVGMSPIYIWRDDSRKCPLENIPHIYTIEEVLEVIPWQ